MKRVHLSLITLAAILCLSVSAYAGTADAPTNDSLRAMRQTQSRARLAPTAIDTESIIKEQVAPHFDYYFTQIEPEGIGEWRKMTVRVKGEGQVKAELVLKGDTPVPGLVREHTTYSRIINFNRAGEEQEMEISFFLPNAWQWDLKVDQINK
jgi:hypothetical protein